MRYLIDTHVLLWFNSGSLELSQKAKEIILDKKNVVLISIASLWEISIKTSIGKLQISGEYESIIDEITKNDIEILPINFAHTVVQNKLPFHHRDPFDRIIIAQGIVENISLISKDEIFDLYLIENEAKRIW